jgi:hypothetical protein
MTFVGLGCYGVATTYDYRMISFSPFSRVDFFRASAIQLTPFNPTCLWQERSLIGLLIAILASLPIPFKALALFVIILRQLVMARRPSAWLVK